MKKLFLSFLVSFFTLSIISAQKSDLMLKGNEKGFYLEHKVVPKESFFSVGRLYNVSPKSIAEFNKLDINKGLFIDQKIKIPLSETNFTQKGNSGTPVYIKTKDKKKLTELSSENGNVSITNLKTWNNLSGDQVKEGTKLIVGFLNSEGMPSITIKNKPVANEPVSKKEDKTFTKPEEIKATETPVTKAEEKPIVKTEEKPVIKAEEKQGPPAPGYFSKTFELQMKISPVVRNETVTSGIFKTTSGWEDGKYYLLMDGVQTGTIVRIANPENNKIVFAKVLGEMAGIRQNQGYNIRISNAAAAALKIQEDDKFIVTINY
jgi:LysM repeat protein